MSFLDPPSLTTKPVNRVVLEGTETTFHCAADGNPVPEIKWMKDGKTVATQGLLIFEAMRNQSGKYWCSVENGLNSTVNASATLDVQCKWECFILLRISMELRLQGCLQVDQCSWMLMFPVPHRKWNLAKLSTDPIFISITNAQQLQVWYLSLHYFQFVYFWRVEADQLRRSKAFQDYVLSLNPFFSPSSSHA